MGKAGNIIHSANEKSPDDWKALIAEQKSSGLNQSQFCRSKGLDKSTFSRHLKKLGGNA
jgi:predicted transcriptional regulator